MTTLPDKPHWTATARAQKQAQTEAERREERERQIREAYEELTPAQRQEALSQPHMRLVNDMRGHQWIMLDLELDDAQHVAEALGLGDKAGDLIDTLVIIARYRGLDAAFEEVRR